jgi:hypothetical protein
MVLISVMLILIGPLVGYILGIFMERRSLLIGADEVTRTPHKLGDKFYYLVPEREYCRMENALLRASYNPDDSNGEGLPCL